MLSRAAVLVAATALLLGGAHAGSLNRADTGSAANPIRRVVSLLQKMQSKVMEEGKKEEELFDRFMCYCNTGTSDLDTSISAAESKVTQDTSSLEQSQALKAQLDSELGEHQTSRSDAKDDIAKATALREKEAATFAKASSDAKTNIAALGKAIAALEKGAFGGFLQTSAAAVVRRLTLDMEMSTPDRDMLSAFLSERQDQGYVPRSGEITGILKQMKDTMEADLAEITGTEQQAIKDFDVLAAAKEKEIAANSKAIEDKTGRVGHVAVEIVSLKEDLDDTTKALLADKGFLADLDKNCATKKQEWETRSQTRAQELTALADTIKLLNDDDALDLFKKTLPSPALLQTKVSGAAVRHRALSILKAVRSQHGHADQRMDVILMALAGNAKSFDKVLKMIDDMVALLGKEQTDDDSKKSYCEAQLDKAEDTKKELEHTAADLDKEIAEAKESIATLMEELAALAAGIKDLDKSVTEATEMRKAENAEFKETMAADQAAKELIGVAKNRLAKFYNPKMYKAPPKTELTREDRIFVNMGGTPPPTEAPGGIAGTGITYLQESAPVFAQVSSHAQTARDVVAPPPPPETWTAYQNKGQEHNGVIAMLDMLVADLDKEMTEITVEEKEAQAEYETFLADSATKRSTDAKAIATKENTKADLEVYSEKLALELKSTQKAAMGKAMFLKDLHLECDWLMQNYQARKDARATEADSLKQAKAILSGADFALVQTAAGRLRGSAASTA